MLRALLALLVARASTTPRLLFAVLQDCDATSRWQTWRQINETMVVDATASWGESALSIGPRDCASFTDNVIVVLPQSVWTLCDGGVSWSIQDDGRITSVLDGRRVCLEVAARGPGVSLASCSDDPRDDDVTHSQRWAWHALDNSTASLLTPIGISGEPLCLAAGEWPDGYV
jgi:hypothetical protein